MEHKKGRRIKEYIEREIPRKCEIDRHNKKTHIKNLKTMPNYDMR